MKILAIDSSGLVATTALLCDDILTGEYTIHNKKTHSQTLLPMIHDMLEMAEVDIGEVEGIAVAAGPGSFTGLRIGASTAKGLAQTLEIPIAAVPALEALAFNLAGTGDLVCPMMDARRGQTYYGLYDVSGEWPEELSGQEAAPVSEVLEKINALSRPVIFLGDGVPVFREQLMAETEVPCRFAADSVRYQRASSVAVLGKKYFEEGAGMKAEKFAPIYLRMSQAERERLEQTGKKYK
ncbi:MAG: tRNA (adenosine(37)-N6)-threonylcarbamoyltransferase complex dimerization subunit type 1 TsaB [Lachnospiraceae bacterium]|nr:tRNA (adenosine(37)-N6)-threonylcarbamoyltransferase complex dimerization subunit type 1 TsaB [Lachnospiraceae bacterium]